MGQDHKPQCLGKSSLILKPLLSLKAKSKEESMTSPTHTLPAPLAGCSCYHGMRGHEMATICTTKTRDMMCICKRIRQMSVARCTLKFSGLLLRLSLDGSLHAIRSILLGIKTVTRVAMTSPLHSLKIHPTLILYALSPSHQPKRLTLVSGTLVSGTFLSGCGIFRKFWYGTNHQKEPFTSFYSILFDILSTTNGPLYKWVH